MNEVMKKPESEEMTKSQSVEEKIETVQTVVRKIGGGPAITVLIFSVVLLVIGAALVARAITVAGRPRLYRTTKEFLRVFHLSSLEELPEMPGLEADGQLRLDTDGAILDPTQLTAAAESEPDAEE